MRSNQKRGPVCVECSSEKGIHSCSRCTIRVRQGTQREFETARRSSTYRTCISECSRAAPPGTMPNSVWSFGGGAKRLRLSFTPRTNAAPKSDSGPPIGRPRACSYMISPKWVNLTHRQQRKTASITSMLAKSCSARNAPPCRQRRPCKERQRCTRRPRTPLSRSAWASASAAEKTSSARVCSYMLLASMTTPVKGVRRAPHRTHSRRVCSVCSARARRRTSRADDASEDAASPAPSSWRPSLQALPTLRSNGRAGNLAHDEMRRTQQWLSRTQMCLDSRQHLDLTVE